MRSIPIPLWIIIEEEDKRRRSLEEEARPTLEIPRYPPYQDWKSYPELDEDNEAQRGEIIIPMW